MTVISWNLQVKVVAGHLAEAKHLIQELVSDARQEKGTLCYEWFLSADETTCHVNERYADCDAVMVHADRFDTQYAERFIACFEPTSLSVYGDPDERVRRTLQELAPLYLGWFGGFERTTRP